MKTHFSSNIHRFFAQNFPSPSISNPSTTIHRGNKKVKTTEERVTITRGKGIKFVSRSQQRNSSNFLFQSRGHYSISRISRLRDIEIFLLFSLSISSPFFFLFSFEISFLHPFVPPFIRHRCAVIAGRNSALVRGSTRSEKKWPSPRVTQSGERVANEPFALQPLFIFPSLLHRNTGCPLFSFRSFWTMRRW